MFSPHVSSQRLLQSENGLPTQPPPNGNHGPKYFELNLEVIQVGPLLPPRAYSVKQVRKALLPHKEMTPREVTVSGSLPQQEMTP